jgi:endonuclease III
MRKKDLKNKGEAKLLLRALEKAYPGAHCSLVFRTPLQLLVATILSAQCTDKRVNIVTPALFKKYPDAESFAVCDLEDLMELVRSTGFYRNKSKNIKACCQRIVEVFGGEVPDNMSDLVTLPGVARKTANVVLFNGFGKNEGVAVDTHVSRISQRLGLSDNTRPELIEKDLLQILPKKSWGQFTHLIIELGRDVCKAPKPNCTDCTLQKHCPWFKDN